LDAMSPPELAESSARSKTTDPVDNAASPR